MSLLDLAPDQTPIESGLRTDMGRLPRNLHRCTNIWRQMAQAGVDPRTGMAEATTNFLGRIWRAMWAIQETPADFDFEASKIGMTKEEIQAELDAWETALLTFQSAPKANITQARNAVIALEAAFPLPKAIPARNFFLDRPLPTGRP